MWNKFFFSSLFVCQAVFFQLNAQTALKAQTGIFIYKETKWNSSEKYAEIIFDNEKGEPTSFRRYVQETQEVDPLKPIYTVVPDSFSGKADPNVTRKFDMVFIAHPKGYNKIINIWDVNDKDYAVMKENLKVIKLKQEKCEKTAGKQHPSVFVKNTTQQIIRCGFDSLHLAANPANKEFAKKVEAKRASKKTNPTAYAKENEKLKKNVAATMANFHMMTWIFINENLCSVNMGDLAEEANMDATKTTAKWYLNDFGGHRFHESEFLTKMKPVPTLDNDVMHKIIIRYLRERFGYYWLIRGENKN